MIPPAARFPHVVGFVLTPFLAACLCAGAARAQVTGANLLEAQSGNYPFSEPKNRWDLYDQMQLEYMFEGGRAGLRLEVSENSDDTFTYQTITQRFAEWSDTYGRIRVGNLYTILGRGIVHRSFELPGVVLDDPGIRSRFGPSRDVDGVLVEGDAGPVSARLLAGRPNRGDISPAGEEFGLERYEDELAGGQIALALPADARIGATYARTSGGFGQREFGSGFAEFDPLRVFGVTRVATPIYVEFAQSDAAFADWWRLRTGDDEPHALYASTNVLWDAWTLSAEWKDYRGFRTGTNDPPSLVREHAFALLNRETHVLDADREEGFQIEASWTHPAWGTVTVNGSRADGMSRRFEEFYAEVHLAPDHGARWDATLFMDMGKDEFDAIVRRRAGGGVASVRFLEHYAVTIDLQRLTSVRRLFFLPSESYADVFASLGVSRAAWGSAALVWERTNDPQEEDPDDFLSPGIQPRTFIAGVIAARLSERHQAQLFVGKRRGGRACTAGTCYDVQSFEGAELRLTTRF